MPKVSVIIPVFNAGEYIEDCVRSLFEQTLDEIEYIFVDDASSDSSLERLDAMLELYPKRQEAVVIIKNTINKGPSYARNLGLEVCTGEYVAFCDSDDIVDTEAYEEMFKTAIQNDSEIVSCGMVIEGLHLELLFDNNASMSFARNIDIAQIEGSLYSSLCNKLIKRELFVINNIRFNDNIRMWDDLYVSFQLRYFCKYDSIINRPYYHYVNTPSSLTKEDSRIKTKSLIQCAKLIEEFINSKEDKAKYNIVVSFIKFRSKDSLFNKNSINEWISSFAETHKSVLRFKRFYGSARTIRYIVVIVFKKTGWNLLELWSRMKSTKPSIHMY